MLPEWIEVGGVQTALAIAIVCLAVAAILSLRLVRKAAKFIILTAAAVTLTVVFYTQWSSLQDCHETCSCRVFNQDITIPESALCGENRVRVDVDVNRGENEDG